MKRREFLTGLGVGALATGLSSCARETGSADCEDPSQTAKQKHNWKMVTTWPPNFPGLGTGALYLARTIEEMTAGRINVKVYGAGELVPAFEVLDAVSDGTAQMGHSASYYWKGKSQAAQLFSAVPFGMNAQTLIAWLVHGDGMKLWQEVYEPFNVIPAAAGHTGMQMGGWFNREIKTLNDLRGLKMRIPGLGGEVLRRAGGTPVSLPGSEIFTSLQTGNIDATEWVGPYNDLAFGLHQVARYYYYPGWHEPNTMLECIINRDAFEALPKDLKTIVLRACDCAAQNMWAEYTARNQAALDTLITEHGVQLRAFPAPVLAKLHELTEQILGEIAASDPLFAKVYRNYRQFQQQTAAWLAISEKAYFDAT